MSEYYGHFDKGETDPTYAAAEFSDFVALIKGTGVANNYLNELGVTVTGAGLSVNVATGGAIVDGYYYFTTAQLTKNIDAQSVGTDRIDRIVVRKTVASKTVTVAVLKGTGAASPSAPALTQTDAVYEISLAQVYVTGGAVTLIADDITDERTYSNNASDIRIADTGGLITATDVETALQEITADVENTSILLSNKLKWALIKSQELILGDNDFIIESQAGKSEMLVALALSPDGTSSFESTMIIPLDENGMPIRGWVCSILARQISITEPWYYYYLRFLSPTSIQVGAQENGSGAFYENTTIFMYTR